MESLIKKWHEHGLDVNRWYNRLISEPSLAGDPLAQEFFENYKMLDGIEQYHINHDIGKPYCIEYDDEGKAHYPNHTELSHKMFIERYGESIYSYLLKHDMTFHTTKGADNMKALWQLEHADHMFASAYAAIMSNAELFGGFESDSFKIKKKHLLKILKYR